MFFFLVVGVVHGISMARSVSCRISYRGGLEVDGWCAGVGQWVRIGGGSSYGWVCEVVVLANRSAVKVLPLAGRWGRRDYSSSWLVGSLRVSPRRVDWVVNGVAWSVGWVAKLFPCPFGRSIMASRLSPWPVGGWLGPSAWSEACRM